MPRLLWDQTGERFYETGVKKVALYRYDSSVPSDFSEEKTYKVGDKVMHNNSTGEKKKYICKVAVETAGAWSDANWTEMKSNYWAGVAWNGISSIQASPSGAEETKIYADDMKYLSLRSAEDFGATVEAYTYPEEWANCDGSASIVPGVTIGQQTRDMFGLCYRTVVGNDVNGNDKGYKLHLIYGATASPSQRQYQTINESPEAIQFSWEIKTTPVDIPGMKPSSELTIDSTALDASGLSKLASLEEMLYGTADSVPYLPMPNAIIDLFKIAG